MRPPSAAKLRRDVQAWNARHPGEGHCVRVWMGYLSSEYAMAVTTSPATVLGGHTAGVYVTPGGFVSLAHVEVK